MSDQEGDDRADESTPMFTNSRGKDSPTDEKQQTVSYSKFYLFVFQALVLIGWYVTNASAAVYNKQALPATSNIIAVIEVTLSQLILGVMIGGLYLFLRSKYTKRPLTQEGLFPPVFASLYAISLAHVIGNIATNGMYLLSSATITQVLKASEPVFTVLLAEFLMG
jgi:hypothetical protein